MTAAPTAPALDSWFLEHLACPRDGGRLTAADGAVRCAAGHEFPVVEGIPVMLLDDVEQTIGIAAESLAAARRYAAGDRSDTHFVETLGISTEEKAGVRRDLERPGAVDSVARYLVGATCGDLYKPLIGTLDAYPIPELRLPPGAGRVLLDVGCNWGRWCVAAGRRGYRPVGIDPSLGAVLAARRITASLGVEARFVVGDARYLPFAEGTFDVVFSYSVLQHFSKDNVRRALGRVASVLRAGGTSLIQMPNAIGVRSLYHLARRRGREARDFEVRYWTPGELKKAFEALVGPSALSVDGYFGLGIQASDAHLMPAFNRMVVHSSEALRAVSEWLPPLVGAADSVYVRSTKASGARVASS